MVIFRNFPLLMKPGVGNRTFGNRTQPVKPAEKILLLKTPFSLATLFQLQHLILERGTTISSGALMDSCKGSLVPNMPPRLSNSDSVLDKNRSFLYQTRDLKLTPWN